MLAGMMMFRGMLVFRRIAASDIAATQTEPQMYPSVAHLDALFASVLVSGLNLDLV